MTTKILLLAILSLAQISDSSIYYDIQNKPMLETKVENGAKAYRYHSVDGNILLFNEIETATIEDHKAITHNLLSQCPGFEFMGSINAVALVNHNGKVLQCRLFKVTNDIFSTSICKTIEEIILSYSFRRDSTRDNSDEPHLVFFNIRMRY